MHKDELIYHYSIAYRKCEAIMSALAHILLLTNDLPEELSYDDMHKCNPQVIAVELQHLLQYGLQSDIRYLKKRTEELLDEHSSN